MKKTPMQKARAAQKAQSGAPKRTSTPAPVRASAPPKLVRAQRAATAARPNPFATVGEDVGNLFGFGRAGGLAGGALGRLFGHGDYQVSTNSLVHTGGQGGVPPPSVVIANDGRRGVRFVEEEFLNDVISGPGAGGTVFTQQDYVINPCSPGTFPWLSTMACQFDEYVVNGLLFRYKTTSGEFGVASQALGAVMLSTRYDNHDPPYLDKRHLENTDYAQSTKPSVDAVHGVECAPAERPTRVLYTRFAGGALPVGAEVNTFDLGIFTLATAGIASPNVTLGELWVSYDITFFKKVLPNTSSILTTTFGMMNQGTQVGTNVPLSFLAGATYSPLGVATTGNASFISGSIGNRLLVTSATPGGSQTLFVPPGLNTGLYRLNLACSNGTSFTAPSTQLPLPGPNTIVGSTANIAANPALFPSYYFQSSDWTPNLSVIALANTGFFHYSYFFYTSPTVQPTTPVPLLFLPTGFIIATGAGGNAVLEITSVSIPQIAPTS